MKIFFKSLVYLFIIASVSYLAIVLWRNYRYVFNEQPHLDNKNYPALLDSIKQVRIKLKKSKASVTVLEKKFIHLLNNRVFAYWYGTNWNFYGTTETPNQGSIACGYFVTTTLQHVGVKLNRAKLAQCASEEMIRTLTSPKNIHHLSNTGIEVFEKNIQKYGKGIYITGLDKHTGFILISDEGNYFIHSSGTFPFQVVKEKLSESNVLIRSKYKVVGKISSDESFLKKWVNS